MHRYRIETRVPTPIRVTKELHVSGFDIAEFTSPEGGMLVSREIEATDWSSAVGLFSQGVNSLLDVISVLTQCAVYAPTLSSRMVFRLDQNPEHIVLFRLGRKTNTTGMMLDKEEVEDVHRILRSPEWEKDRTAFRFLRLANLAESPIAWLSVMIMAAEAFAGTSTLRKNCGNCGHTSEYAGTDRNALKQILGEPLQKAIYDRLRHALFHGGAFDESRASLYAPLVHREILLRYLKKKYELESVREITSAPRNSAYEVGQFFTQAGHAPTLEALVEKGKCCPHVDGPDDY